MLIASIGLFLEILNVGKKLPRNAERTETPIIRTICLIPAFKSVMSTGSFARTIPFNTLQITIVAIEDNTKLIAAIIKLSLKKIPNTSLPLAPSARRTPISLFFYEIYVEMKFISISAANNANPRATQTNTLVIIKRISSSISSIGVEEL